MANTDPIITDSITTDSPPTDPSDDSAFQLHLGYERVRAQVEALPLHDLEPLNLDVAAVVQTVLGTLPAVLALRPKLARLDDFNIEYVDRLHDYALALGHLHNKHRLATGTPSTALLKELFAVRERLHTDAQPLMSRGLLDPMRVGQLKSGNSHQGLAYDVIGLVELYLERWKEFGGRLFMERADLEHARLLGNRLLSVLGEREQGPSLVAEVSQMRQRAFTLTVRAYNEVRHGVAFVRRAEGDEDDITPSLYAGRAKRSRADSEETNPTLPITEEGADVAQEIASRDRLNAAVAKSLAVHKAGPAGGTALVTDKTEQASTNIPVGFPGAAPLGQS